MGFFSRKKDKDAGEPAHDEGMKPKAEPEPAPVQAAEKVSEDVPQEKGNGSYFVSPHPDGGWQVKRAKAKKALKRFKTKAEAEAYAKQVAKNQGASVVRQKKDGKIQKKV